LVGNTNSFGGKIYSGNIEAATGKINGVVTVTTSDIQNRRSANFSLLCRCYEVRLRLVDDPRWFSESIPEIKK